MAIARWKLALGAGALGTFLALGAAELWARAQTPTRVQKFYSAREMQFDVIDGQPIWIQDVEGSAERANLACIETNSEAPRILLLGSSIFYGSDLETPDTLGPRLTEAIAEVAGQSPCVHNLSEPGYTFQPQWARLSAEINQIEPDVLVLEVWENSPYEFKVLGDAAYNFGRLELDSSGHPNPWGLGEGMNNWLLDQWGLYRYLVLGSTPELERRNGADWEAFTAQQMTSLIDWTEAEGLDLVLVFCPKLSGDFATTAKKNERSYGHVERLADERGVPYVQLTREFIGQDPTELGLDSCCHFNSYGTIEVAQRIAPVVDALTRGQ